MAGTSACNSYCTILVIIFLLGAVGIIGLFFEGFFATAGPSLSFYVPLCRDNRTYHFHQGNCSNFDTESSGTNETIKFTVPVKDFRNIKPQNYEVSLLRISLPGTVNLNMYLEGDKSIPRKNVSGRFENEDEKYYSKDFSHWVYIEGNTSSCNDSNLGCQRNYPFSTVRTVLDGSSFTYNGNDESVFLYLQSLTITQNRDYENGTLYIRIEPIDGTNPNANVATVLLAICAIAGIIVPFLEGLLAFIFARACNIPPANY